MLDIKSFSHYKGRRYWNKNTWCSGFFEKNQRRSYQRSRLKLKRSWKTGKNQDKWFRFSLCYNDGSTKLFTISTSFWYFYNTSRWPETITLWKSKGLPWEIIRLLVAPVNSLAPKRKSIYSSKIEIEFKTSCFKVTRAIFTQRNVVNLFIYELYTWSRNLNTKFTSGDCFYGIWS